MLGTALDAIHVYGDVETCLGLPVWLPALWAIGGLAIRRLFGPLASQPSTAQ